MKNTKIISLAIIALVVSLGFLALGSQIKQENTGFIGEARGAVDTTNLTGDIEDAIEDYIPLIVVLTLIGIALSALGINMARKH